MKLTAKQEAFTNEYLIDSNATASAKRAGYSNNTTKEIGYKFIHKSLLKPIIEKKLEERTINTGITAEFVINGINTIAIEGNVRVTG